MENTDKKFNSLITYMKGICLMMFFACLIAFFFVNTMPFFTLEQLVFNDIYGTPQMPDDARPAFVFAFLLFNLASIVACVFQYGVVKHSIAKKEKWGYQVYTVNSVLWVIGVSCIALYTGAHSYFLSAGIMTLVLIPPVFLLKKYF